MFEDANVNCVNDGEVDLARVFVSANGTRALTDDSGIYEIHTQWLAHTVVETDPAGYRSTTPNLVTPEVALAQSYVVNNKAP